MRRRSISRFPTGCACHRKASCISPSTTAFSNSVRRSSFRRGRMSRSRWSSTRASSSHPRRSPITTAHARAASDPTTSYTSPWDSPSTSRPPKSWTSTPSWASAVSSGWTGTVAIVRSMPAASATRWAWTSTRPMANSGSPTIRSTAWVTTSRRESSTGSPRWARISASRGTAAVTSGPPSTPIPSLRPMSFFRRWRWLRTRPISA